MKKHSKHFNKNKTPLTAFGEKIKNAIAKPFAENKTNDNNQKPNIPHKTPPKIVSTRADENGAKQNLTYKIGDVKPAAPVNKPSLPTKPQTQVQFKPAQPIVKPTRPTSPPTSWPTSRHSARMKVGVSSALLHRPVSAKSSRRRASGNNPGCSKTAR